MSTLDKKLGVTNLFLLWLYEHGWEDPDWGQSDVGQISIVSAIHELANQITDSEIRTQIQKVAAKSIATTAEKMTSRS